MDRILSTVVETQGSMTDLLRRFSSIDQKLEGLDDTVTKHAEQLDSLAARVSAVENGINSSADKSSGSPAPEGHGTNEVVLVAGSNEGPRPDAALVASLLGRPVDEVIVPHAASKIVQFVDDAQRLDVIKHKLCGSGLWCNPKRSEAQGRTFKEWKAIAAWANESIQEFEVDMREKAIYSKTGLTLAMMSSKQDHIVWKDQSFRLKWLGRKKE